MKTYCKAPFLGPTIDPSGKIILCCAAERDYLDTHINSIDSIQDFFDGEQYSKTRTAVALHGIEKLGSVCEYCLNSRKADPAAYTQIDHYKQFTPNKDSKVSYLEVTTSNVCNQTCATCESYFSSKWRKIHNIFHDWEPAPSYIMNDKALQSVLETLPNLTYLTLKGGEPTADRNNLKILNRLIEVNPECEVGVVSNFQEVSDDWWKVIESLKNLNIAVSVDGIGETYDWIRGGNYESTLANIKWCSKMYPENTLRINVLVSLYNIFDLKNIYDVFTELNIGIIMNNITYGPDYASPFVFSYDELSTILNDEYGSVSTPFIPQRLMIESNFHDKYKRPYNINKCFEFINKMDSLRGFSLFDVQPKLKKALMKYVRSS